MSFTNQNYHINCIINDINLYKKQINYDVDNTGRINKLTRFRKFLNKNIEEMAILINCESDHISAMEKWLTQVQRIDAIKYKKLSETLNFDLKIDDYLNQKFK